MLAGDADIKRDAKDAFDLLCENWREEIAQRSGFSTALVLLPATWDVLDTEVRCEFGGRAAFEVLTVCVGYQLRRRGRLLALLSEN